MKGTDDPLYDFERTEAAILLEGGEIAVVSSQRCDVRVFGPDGKFRRQYGKRGDGPGEFRQVRYSGRSADTMYLYDLSNNRLTTLNAKTGLLAMSVRPTTQGGIAVPIQRFSDGSFLYWPFVGLSMRHREGVFRDSRSIWVGRFDDPKPLAELGPFQGLTLLASNPGNLPRALSVGRYRFGPQLSALAVDTLVIVAEGGEPELSFVSRTGKVVRRINIALPRATFDRASLDRQRRKALEGVSDRVSRIAIANDYDEKFLPSVAPSIRAVFRAADGAIWVEAFRAELERDAQFVILSASGAETTRGAFPGGIDVLEIGRDYVLGAQRDADGVASIVKFKRNSIFGSPSRR